MKNIKKALCFLLCIASILSMTGCPGPMLYIEVKKSPEKFPGSTWSTESGDISFWVDDKYSERFVGYIELPDGTEAPRNGIETNIYGEISFEGEKYEFFVYITGFYDGLFSWYLISEEMPTYGDYQWLEDGTLNEYNLVSFNMRFYKNRCIGEVKRGGKATSKIYETGVKFEFFRTDIE